MQCDQLPPALDVLSFKPYVKRFLPSVALARDFVAAMRKASGACMEPTVLHSLMSELRTVYDVCEAEGMPHTRVQSSRDCLSNRHVAEHWGNGQTTEPQTASHTHPTPPFLHIMAPERVTQGVGIQISLPDSYHSVPLSDFFIDHSDLEVCLREG